MPSNPDEVGTVMKAFMILDLFRQQESWGVTEIAQRLGASKGSVYRFLTSLKRLGLIRQDGQTSRYHPDVGLLELAGIYLSRLDWLEAVRPVLQDLSRKTHGETVHLAIRDQDKVIYVDKIEGTARLRLVSEVGVRWAAHSTGTGKALLAALAEDEIRELYAGRELTPFTPHTITDLGRLLDDLRLARRNGYAIESEENEVGVISIGGVIRGLHGEAVAALSATGPVARINGPAVAETSRLVAEAAQAASRLLGAGSKFLAATGGETPGS